MTEPSTTAGWMPTASPMTRGWMMFMTTNQPAIMRASVGRSASGLVRRATATGGAHEMNGPKNGIACRMPELTAVSGAKSRPSRRLVPAATRPYTKPMSAWPRRKPPNERDTLTSRRANSSA